MPAPLLVTCTIRGMYWPVTAIPVNPSRTSFPASARLRPVVGLIPASAVFSPALVILISLFVSPSIVVGSAAAAEIASIRTIAITMLIAFFKSSTPFRPVHCRTARILP